MADEAKPDAHQQPDSPIVGVDPPRTVSDVWDDRIKMAGAVVIALLLIIIMAWLATHGEGNTAIVGAFVLALDRVIRYFFSTGTAA